MVLCCFDSHATVKLLRIMVVLIMFCSKSVTNLVMKMIINDYGINFSDRV